MPAFEVRRNDCNWRFVAVNVAAVAFGTAYRAFSMCEENTAHGIAHACLKTLTDGSSRGIAEVALAFKMDASDVSRILPLDFLAPSLTEMILVGRQPADLTLRMLTRLIDLPIQWQQQIANLAR